MKKLISKHYLVWLTGIAIFLPGSVLAHHVTQASRPRPEFCPEVSALREIRVTVSDLIEVKPGRDVCCDAQGFPYHENGTWEVREYIGSYGTREKWRLRLRDVTAENENDALRQFNNSLLALTFEYGPRSEFGQWYCEYRSSRGSAATWLM